MGGQRSWKHVEPQEQSGSLNNSAERPNCLIIHLVEIKIAMDRFQLYWKKQYMWQEKPPCHQLQEWLRWQAQDHMHTVR